MLSRNTFLITLGIFVVGGVVLWGFSAKIRAAVDSHTTSTLVSKLQECEKGAALIPCARPYIKKLLAFKSGTEVMQLLSDAVTPAQCHYMGHIVGQELYRAYKDIEPAISQCSSACFSACVHGEIGEAFVQEAGLDSADADVVHLSPDEMRTVGKRLCTKDSSCHAVGHVFFQAYGEVPSANALCSGISSGTSLRSCFVGVFMEYANELSSKSVWNTSSALKRPPVDSPTAFCNQTSSDERRSCFAIFPELVVETLQASDETLSSGAAVADVLDVCESIEDPQSRHFCAEGVGKYSYALVLSDVDAAVRLCTRFTRPTDQQWCVRGMVFRASHYDKPDKVLSFCAALPTQELTRQCHLDMAAERQD